MMNSLGYDASLETDKSPLLGVQNKWVSPTTSGSTTTPGSAKWIDGDLNTNGSDLIGDSSNQK